MKRSARFKKSLSLLFIGLYLVFGGALGHAFVWCAEPGDYTHLEYNPAGDCGIQCAADSPATTTSAGDTSIDSQPCEDLSSKALFSEVPSPRVDDPVSTWALFATDTVPWMGLVVPPQPFVSFSPVPAPDRPPTIVQVSIKTVVLRH